MIFDCTVKGFGTVANLTQKSKGDNFVDIASCPKIFACPIEFKEKVISTADQKETFVLAAGAYPLQNMTFMEYFDLLRPVFFCKEYSYSPVTRGYSYGAPTMVRILLTKDN